MTPIRGTPARDAGAARDPADERRRPAREARAVARLDALEWCPTLGPFQAVGFSFGVRVMDPPLAAYLEKALASLSGPPRARHLYSVVDHGPRSHSVYLDGMRVIRTPSPSMALSYLLWHLNRSVIRESPSWLLLHASAAERAGRAVLMPAPMESGKTTLVSGLVRRGLRYVTDEAVAIDPRSLEVHPYPKPLSIDPGSWSVLSDLRPDLADGATAYLGAQWHVAPTSIRPDAVAGACRPRLVVSPRYQRGAATELEPVSRAQGLLLLADNSFNFRQHGPAALECLAEVVRGCDCYRLTMDDLDEACSVVIDRLEATGVRT